MSDDTLWVSVPPVVVPYYLKILVIRLTANHQNFLWVHLCLSLLFLLFQFSSVSFVEFHHALYNNNNFPHILTKIRHKTTTNFKDAYKNWFQAHFVFQKVIVSSVIWLWQHCWLFYYLTQLNTISTYSLHYTCSFSHYD